uniref:Importin subunit alpha n=1 Tax=Glossina brevipalpis TaxID=37001 RepID=A0A1A9WCB0_9MUSC
MLVRRRTMNMERKNSYKSNAINTDDSRSRRHTVIVELRKSKKEDHLFKRRNINENDLVSPIKESDCQSPKSMYMDETFRAMCSEDPQMQFSGMLGARKFLSRQKNPPIDEMIDLGIVPLCIEFLQKTEYPHLQIEAAWALTNIASGNSNQTGCVVNHNAVPLFVKLLYSEYSNLAEQCVWALGNIAGDGPIYRDIVIQNNAIDGILQLLYKDTSLSVQRNLVWLMSNLCRNKNPIPPFEEVKRLLPILSKLLWSSDEQVITDVCWALSYVTDDNDMKTQAVIDTGALPRLVSLLDANHPGILVPALRTVGNIVTGTDQQTDAVIAAGALLKLKKLLKYQKPNIVKETSWTLSNITAGNRDQIQAVIDSGIFEEIRNILKHGDFKSQKEAAYVVTNTSTGGTPQQVMALIEKYQILKPLCDLLEANDQHTIIVVLSGLMQIFGLINRMGGIENFCVVFEEIGALDKLEKLQQHENEDIYKKAFIIIDTYFSEVDPVEADLAPQELDGTLEFNPNESKAPGGGFTF